LNSVKGVQLKKVLFVISSLSDGGAQRALSNIVMGFPDDWEIDILLNSAENITYPYKGNIIELGISRPTHYKNVFFHLKLFFRRFFTLRRLKKSNSYQACISFLESANAVNVLTGKKHCKIFLSVRNHLSNEPSFMVRIIVKAAVRLLYNRADKIISLSDGVRNDLIGNYRIAPDKIQTIYNGFNIDAIRQNRQHDIAGATGFTFVTMGRLSQQKGQWHLVRAFSRLIESSPDCRLVILGDGPYRSYLEQLISEYDLTRAVRLTGFIENPFKELACADVFVFTSLYEGFANAVIEAMACGLPVISSDYRFGAREILAPDTDIDFEQRDNVEYAKYGIITPVCSGIEYKAGDQLEGQELLLADAMEKLYRDIKMAEEYKNLSIERANHFSIEKTVDELIALIC